MQQIFLSMWFKVEGQVVERWEWPTSTLQLTLVGAASTLGHALRVGKQRKMAAHAEACRAVGVLFVPLVVESVGRWSDEAIHTIASIGCLQGQRLGIPRQRVYDTSSRDWPSRYGKRMPPVDLLPASLSCHRGRTDLTDLVTFYLYIYLYICFYYLYICVCCFYALHHC